jgi:hypothetical protein
VGEGRDSDWERGGTTQRLLSWTGLRLDCTACAPHLHCTCTVLYLYLFGLVWVGLGLAWSLLVWASFGPKAVMGDEHSEGQTFGASCQAAYLSY